VFALKIASGAFQPSHISTGVTMTGTHVLEAHQLVKRFGEFEAVKGIDVEIDRAKALASLAPTALARRARCG